MGKKQKSRDVNVSNTEKSVETGGKVFNIFNSKGMGMAVSVIHIILTLFLLGEILYLNVLPVWMFMLICFAVLVLCALSFLMAFGKKSVRIVGKLISLLMITVNLVGIYYLSQVNDALDNVAGNNTKVDVVNVYVMKADQADDIVDAKDYTFGIMGVLDRVNTDKTIDKIEEQLKKKIATEEYEGYLQLVEALYEGEVQAIILNEAYIAQIVDNEEYASFETVTKVLHNESHETQIEVDDKIDVKDNVFTMYISGIDVTGKISTTSRSDVNILAIINPDTRQVLLLNTPRDYYVPLAMNGIEDKLTHAGIYGIDESMATLENLYETEVDYYFRVNFTGFEKMIDALGGIEVYSDYSFRTLHGNYKIVKGMNSMNGHKALCFARERFALPAGDNDRGKNHMKIIKVVLDKLLSPSILNDFTGLMDSVKDCFQTSMSSSQISSLVRMQLEEGGSWNVVNYAVSGEGALMPVYSMSSHPYVTIPDYKTVDIAKQLIDMVHEGKILSDEIVADLQKEAEGNKTGNDISTEDKEIKGDDLSDDKK